jgi:hypothetical protein
MYGLFRKTFKASPNDFVFKDLFVEEKHTGFVFVVELDLNKNKNDWTCGLKARNNNILSRLISFLNSQNKIFKLYILLINYFIPAFVNSEW